MRQMYGIRWPVFLYIYIYLHLVDFFNGKCRYNIPYMEHLGQDFNDKFSLRILCVCVCDIQGLFLKGICCRCVPHLWKPTCGRVNRSFVRKLFNIDKHHLPTNKSKMIPQTSRAASLGGIGTPKKHTQKTSSAGIWMSRDSNLCTMSRHTLQHDEFQVVLLGSQQECGVGQMQELKLGYEHSCQECYDFSTTLGMIIEPLKNPPTCIYFPLYCLDTRNP